MIINTVGAVCLSYTKVYKAKGMFAIPSPLPWFYVENKASMTEC